MVRTILATLVVALVSGSTTPAGAKAEWVEKKLIAADEVDILFRAASSILAQKKLEGARIAILAAGPGLQELLQRTVIPRNRALIKQYDGLAATAYAGLKPGDLGALVTKHEPLLVPHADKLSLPPIGPSFKNSRERIQRVLAAKDGLKEAIKAATDYVKVAPDVTKHMAAKSARKVMKAVRSIMLGAISLTDHVRIASAIAKSDAAEIRTKLDAFVKGENLSQITSYATSEQAYAQYLKQFGLTELATSHEAHAKEAFESAKRISAARLAKNRIPRETYTGGDKETLRKLVKRQFLEKYPGSKVLAVRIAGSNFSVQWEWVRLKGDRWAWRKIRRLQFAYVAYQGKNESGETCHVFPMRIEQMSTGGGYGNYYVYRPAQYYPFDMLTKNL